MDPDDTSQVSTDNPGLSPRCPQATYVPTAIEAAAYRVWWADSAGQRWPDSGMGGSAVTAEALEELRDLLQPLGPMANCTSCGRYIFGDTICPECAR